MTDEFHAMSMREFDERVATFLGMHNNTPPGIVRRVAPVDLSDPKKQEQVDEAKRNMLKLMALGGVAAIGGGGAVVGALQYAQPPMEGLATFPRVQLFYDDGTPIVTTSYKYTPQDLDQIIFDYPLTNEVNMLLILPQAAPQIGGVGPGQNIVAYSAICQHLGCVPPFISYYPAGSCNNYYNGKAFLHCICHGSTYDPALRDTSTGGGAQFITGPTVLPLPQVILEEDSNHYLYAVSMIGPPVKGHFKTLTGGTGVSSQVLASAPSPPSQACPTQSPSP